ncbi:tRNA (adenine(37)-N6)-methyltransferase isoform X1 [Drosophila teissieri]|uniref:tRNA (adenine(37)-N6)-methyltransferase isoform X1 n=1 Tax=Drosophila teissieri TaxID=7243 RepID=UPI001CBA36ED|nr:tRNA (adenine(37)-N6)-methyltransferase isoform X1 [Drosophila teissieri]
MHEDDLKSQLTIARNEINNLRQQVRNLQHVQRKDIETITRLLQDFRCEGCASNNKSAKDKVTGEKQEHQQQTPDHQTGQGQSNHTNGGNSFGEDYAHFRPIGVIRTAFPEKRAVPRQSIVGSRLRGIIQLNDGVFTNPEHSLEGLADFSHLWVIYHFHRNNAHPKAKVAPPRLGGERVGVFSTRSPHRPCPIGLSLVEIEKIENATISFFGTDMVDGTPVLDIKPYIPHYDAPSLSVDSGTLDVHQAEMQHKFLFRTGRTSVGPHDSSLDFYDSRQEPDGEESDLELYGAAGYSGNSGIGADAILPPPSAVRVPNWVVASNRLSVTFNEHAEAQLMELQVKKQCIVDILEADPRSVYLRTKYGSQIFTFQLREVTVTCKFDDKAGTVTVVQVRRNENVQVTALDGDLRSA